MKKLLILAVVGVFLGGLIPTTVRAAPVAPFTDGFDCPVGGLDERMVYSGEFAGTLNTDVEYDNAVFGATGRFDKVTGLVDVIAPPCDYPVAQWSDILAPFSFGSGGGSFGTTTIQYQLIGNTASSSSDQTQSNLWYAYWTFFVTMVFVIWLFRSNRK